MPDGTLYAGVESTFVYNGLTLNDRTLVNKYRITQINGLSHADIRDARESRSGRDGERALQAFYAGRTISLGGRIEALNDHLHGLRVMTTALTGALGDLTEKTLLIDCGSLGGYDTQIDCRPSQPLAMTDEIKGWFHYRDFLITLRASDPRIVSQTLNDFTFTAAATSYASQPLFAHANDGNYKADLIINLKGPMTNPSILLGSTTFSFLGGTVIPLGQEWVIDTKAGTVKTTGGISKYNLVSFTSTLPYYVPGNNSLLFSGTSLTAGTTQVRVRYRHTWI